MSKTKHAPVPWHVAAWEVRDNDGAVEAEGWQVAGADGYAINTCISAGDGEQEEANVHFIVRAVNSHEHLVAALKMAKSALEDEYLGFNDVDLSPNGAVTAVRAALAAAEAA